MRIRLAEQLLASGGTFAISVVALRSLNADALSSFFLLICGSQVATVALAARRITPYIRLNENLQAAHLGGSRAVLEVIGAALLVMAATLLLHNGEATTRFDLLAILSMAGFASGHLLYEWFRRTTAVLFLDGVPASVIAAQLLRLTGPLFIGLLIALHWQSATAFFASMALTSLSAALCYASIQQRRKVGTAGAQRGAAQVATAPMLSPAFDVLNEAYHVLAWANVPIALLAIISGSLSVARLVEVRTPLSFFNPLIEFIEVHIRRINPNIINLEKIFQKLLMIVAFWILTSVAIYAYGDVIISVISNRPITGLAADMLAFWWLQLIAVADRLTHNFERAAEAVPTPLMPTIAAGLTLLLLTVALIWLLGTTGCIFAMCAWCLTSILLRHYYHPNTNQNNRHGP